MLTLLLLRLCVVQIANTSEVLKTPEDDETTLETRFRLDAMEHLGDNRTEPDAMPAAKQEAYLQTPYADVEPYSTVDDFQPANVAPTPSHVPVTSAPKIRRYRPSLWGRAAFPIIIVLIVAAIVWFSGITRQPEEKAGPAESAEPMPSVSAYERTPTLPAERPFDDGMAIGTFAVESAEQTADTLTVKVKISLEEGGLTYSFMAIDPAPNSGNIFDTEPSSAPNQLDYGFMDAGEEVSGFIVFKKAKGPTQVALTNQASSRNIAMVRIPD